ncbi:MAG: reverse transcriptase/maturase family protein [Candidatus Zambryskibacteria bacterium]|nr:reverse transcriptase/maturase family protein [Candidatus Zambryskibacteria bacterium]
MSLTKIGKTRWGGAFYGLNHSYDSIISVENLLEAWKEFVRWKRGKKDVQEFQLSLMDNILSLHADLSDRNYCHGGYHPFNISDPKPRNIHKATVRDRLLHHAVYRILYPYFDKRFIHDSYSCRLNKGTHRALNRFMDFGNRVSRNYTKQCWVLKCDVRKFFASVNHEILLQILAKYIQDKDTAGLLKIIITSFHSTGPGKGLPLGNLTSQLLVNIYMNEFDQFMKHKLKAKHYIRYADDFVILSSDKDCLCTVYQYIVHFLGNKLKLELHPDKVFIKTYASGVDFLGWVHFPDHRVLRTVTKRRMFKNLSKNFSEESRASYLGLLKHGNTQKLRKKILN